MFFQYYGSQKFFNANQLVKNLVNIDQKFFKVVELLKILGATIKKNTSKVHDVCILGMI
jgi:hypothetical protein